MTFFLGPGRRGSLSIVTYVMKITNDKGKVSYEIKQRLPLTDDPFYDGDFTTNRIIERHGRSEWIRAEHAIDNDKIKDRTKNES